jgi:hypothetical protein
MWAVARKGCLRLDRRGTGGAPMADDERDRNAPKPSTKGEPDSWWSAYSKLEPHTLTVDKSAHNVQALKKLYGALYKEIAAKTAED